MVKRRDYGGRRLGRGARAQRMWARSSGRPTTTQLADYSIQLSGTAVHVGTNVFAIENSGTQEHEFIGFKIDQPVTKLALTSDGDLNEDVLDNVTDGDNLQPGTEQTRTVILTEPGTYLFVCNLPGHFAKGMYTEIHLP
jgi:uncharacterized cupredoxin-like copper-binding protein